PADPAPVAQKVLVNVDEEGTAILGFDSVAYHTDNKVTPGSGDHAVAHGGGNFWFANPEHKATFSAEPAKYAPQYGGYCAYAMAQGRLSPVQPEVFEIYEGQLLLFTNPEFKKLFDADPAKHKAAADQNWPKLLEEHGKPAPVTAP
ncbi:MAG: YHS domain-containing (seleno)protein, partial [Kofleriaceae bacterium]